MPHEFSRTELLIGKEALSKLSQSKVAIFGIGGVAHLLWRAWQERESKTLC